MRVADPDPVLLGHPDPDFQDIIRVSGFGKNGTVSATLVTTLTVQAVKTDNKLLFENKNKFLLVHSSSGFKHALKEVLQDPAVQARLTDTKETSKINLKNIQVTLKLVHMAYSERSLT